MTIQFARTPEDALKAVFDAKSAALSRLMGVRKALAGAAGWRGQFLRKPEPLNQDMILLEQQIDRQIASLESLIILHARLTQDIYEAQGKTP